MGPESDLSSSPGKKNIRMMPLLLRNFPYAVHKVQSLAKIRKLEGLAEVVFAHGAPPLDLLEVRFQFLALERRNSTLARHTRFAG